MYHFCISLGKFIFICLIYINLFLKHPILEHFMKLWFWQFYLRNILYIWRHSYIFLKKMCLSSYGKVHKYVERAYLQSTGNNSCSLLISFNYLFPKLTKTDGMFQEATVWKMWLTCWSDLGIWMHRIEVFFMVDSLPHLQSDPTLTISTTNWFFSIWETWDTSEL